MSAIDILNIVDGIFILCVGIYIFLISRKG